MSGIKYKSQINMPVPPTEDSHVMRKSDVGAINYELTTRLEFLESIIHGLGGNTTIAAPILEYDAIKTLQFYNKDDLPEAAAYLNDMGLSFLDSSGNGYHAETQVLCTWTDKGVRVNEGADTGSYIALPAGNINEIMKGANWTVFMALTLDAINRRHNFFSDYNVGMNLAIELTGDNRLRCYFNSSPDIYMPQTVWRASLGKPMYMAIACKPVQNNVTLDMYIDGKFMWSHSFEKNMNMFNNQPHTEFWLGNDRRQTNAICTKGVIHNFQIYDKHLSNYEVLKRMQVSMENYG